MDSTCKHCGEPGESYTRPDGVTIRADVCYGCRARYKAAQALISVSLDMLLYAQHLLQSVDEDTRGIQIADGMALPILALRVSHDATVEAT